MKLIIIIIFDPYEVPGYIGFHTTPLNMAQSGTCNVENNFSTDISSLSTVMLSGRKKSIQS